MPKSRVLGRVFHISGNYFTISVIERNENQKTNNLESDNRMDLSLTFHHLVLIISGSSRGSDVAETDSNIIQQTSAFRFKSWLVKSFLPSQLTTTGDFSRKRKSHFSSAFDHAVPPFHACR